MTSPFAFPERVPYAAVERLLRTFSALQQIVADALAASDATGATSTRWQRAFSLLEQERSALQVEADAFQAGDRQALLRHAADLRLLARRMDGYALSFAGDETGKALTQQRQLLVLTAWQIAAAASGSEAAGL